MSATIINGKQIASEFRNSLKEKISQLNDKEIPVLAVISVGEDPASKVYVKTKKKFAQEIGMACEIIELSDSIGENALLEVIDELNNNHHINGIIVQLPLPKHINQLNVLSRIHHTKDVDGFTPYNIGLLSYNDPQGFISATPKGILHLLKSTGIDLTGKHAVIIGRSNIVGKPLAMLLLNQNCSVTVVHSKSENIENITRTADILIAACGQTKMIKSSWIKEGAIIIDVGINRNEEGLCGDVDFDNVKNKASFITPVPGGVGPMTVAMLLDNTYQAFCHQQINHTCHCNHKNCKCH